MGYMKFPPCIETIPGPEAYVHLVYLNSHRKNSICASTLATNREEKCDVTLNVEGTNVITGHKCNKGHKCNNICSQM